MCDCKVGPGKFEGKPTIAFLAWERVVLGNIDDRTGCEGETVDWLRSPLGLASDQSAVDAALAYGYCRECVETAGEDVDGGVAVWEDLNGFVYARVFHSRATYDKALLATRAEDETDDEHADYHD